MFRIPKYWVIAPYESSYPEVFDTAWKYDLKHDTIAVGWMDLGDISSSEWDDLWYKVKVIYTDKTERSCTIDTNALWRFYHEIAVGDKILARRGRMKLLAVGTVTKTAYYDENMGKERVAGLTEYYYPNFIGVKWEEREIDFDRLAFAMNTLTGPFDYGYYEDLIRGQIPEPAEDVSSGMESFMLEQHLEDFIVTNFDRIFNGKYELFITEDGVDGKQYPITNDSGRIIGRIDILAISKEDSSFLVIELKRDSGTDTAIGQILWYMGWVKTNLCSEGQSVRGLIVCTDKDERLDYAREMVADKVDVKFYSVSFHLQDTPSP